MDRSIWTSHRQIRKMEKTRKDLGGKMKKKKKLVRIVLYTGVGAWYGDLSGKVSLP